MILTRAEGASLFDGRATRGLTRTQRRRSIGEEGAEARKTRKDEGERRGLLSSPTLCVTFRGTHTHTHTLAHGHPEHGKSKQPHKASEATSNGAFVLPCLIAHGDSPPNKGKKDAPSPSFNLFAFARCRPSFSVFLLLRPAVVVWHAVALLHAPRRVLTFPMIALYMCVPPWTFAARLSSPAPPLCLYA